MDEDHGGAAVEFIEDRIEPLVAEIHAIEVGQHDDAVELEGVERVCDLLERTVNVGQRQAGEAAEATAMLRRSCARQTR